MKNQLNALLAIAMISASATANAEASAWPPKCSLVAQPGIYEVEVPALHTLDVCAKDGLKIKTIATLAELAGWKMTQHDGVFHLGASADSKPTNLIIHFKDGSRAEYRLRPKASGDVSIGALKS